MLTSARDWPRMRCDTLQPRVLCTYVGHCRTLCLFKTPHIPDMLGCVNYSAALAHFIYS